MRLKILIIFISLIVFIYSYYFLKLNKKSNNLLNNREIKKKIITIKPYSNLYFKMNNTFSIVPLTEYASSSNFFGIRTNDGDF